MLNVAVKNRHHCPVLPLDYVGSAPNLVQLTLPAHLPRHRYQHLTDHRHRCWCSPGQENSAKKNWKRSLVMAS